MNLQLVTLTGTKLDQDVYEVVIPTESGEIAVFPDHEPLVTLAQSGVIQVRRAKTDSDDDVELFAISGGVVEVTGDHVRVLVDEADYAPDIVEAEIKKALERALKMRDEATDQIALEKAHQLVDRHIVRLKVADLHRRKRRKNL
ncbi:ATP synthase F1 subunit epsilon [Candidatus Saccharibacteria bacterium]|nr:MAG: ATP synthase F1 subunit epsilon [Candidatus Saccharibacteria bacterium]